MGLGRMKTRLQWGDTGIRRGVVRCGTNFTGDLWPCGKATSPALLLRVQKARRNARAAGAGPWGPSGPRSRTSQGRPQATVHRGLFTRAFFSKNPILGQRPHTRRAHFPLMCRDHGPAGPGAISGAHSNSESDALSCNRETQARPLVREREAGAWPRGYRAVTSSEKKGVGWRLPSQIASRRRTYAETSVFYFYSRPRV